MTPISVTTVGDCLAGAAATWSHDALVLPSGRQSHPELDARVDEFACGLLAVGVELRERFGLLFDLQPGAAATEQELVEHCLGTIATFKVPRYVRFVEDYPMSGTKVKKHVLRERIAAELVAAGITSAPKLSTRG